MAQQPARLGFLYPGYAAEDDYERMAGMLSTPVTVELFHTSVGEDAHRVDALLDLGSDERLTAGARVLGERGVDVAVWACTSGSFVFGWNGASKQVAAIKGELGVPASSTSFAFVNALNALGISRVAIAATYPEDVAAAFADFLESASISTAASASEDIITAEEVGTFGRERVVSMIEGAAKAEAGAILVPDTALHTVAWLEELEAVAGKPVLTANQVTMFEALRLAGRLKQQDGMGSLFRDFDPGKLPSP